MAGTGSSPLARGLRDEYIDMRQAFRIIPARAGFTVQVALSTKAIRDHPRSRGVYLFAAAFEERRQGSSPLARGLQCRGGPHPGARRIIPARAGFTECPSIPRRRAEDHPRSRGVYPTVRSGTAAHRGSSPLARGLHSGRGPDRCRLGIIPARAGFTGLRRHPGRGPSDHPRSRGVYRIRRCVPPHMRGSSPLARGLPAQHLQQRGPGGIIPARAGFTIMFIVAL